MMDLKLGHRIIAASLVGGLLLSPVLANAAPTVDGSIEASDGWNSVFTSAPGGLEVFIQSDATNLYFGGSTPDDDDGKPGTGNFNDAFNINFGLDGNAAAWRYRLLSENQSFTDNGGSSTTFDGAWEGFLQGGDDSVVANASFGVPGSLTNLDATQVEYAVSDDNGNREHEFAIPWALLIDGQNGWNAGSSLALRVAGFYGEDGSSSAIPDGVDFGDQSTYVQTTVHSPAKVPLPATALMLLAGLGALGFVRQYARS